MRTSFFLCLQKEKLISFPLLRGKRGSWRERGEFLLRRYREGVVLEAGSFGPILGRSLADH